jgi:hypothetical protein
MPDARSGIRGRGPVTPKKGMLFSGMFLAIWLIALVFAVSWYTDAKSPENWPSTVGVITETDVRFEFSHGKGPHNNYHPEVNYTYSVDGRTYHGDQISKSSKSFRTNADAQLFIENYTVGSHVEVFYDPDNPSDAVLESQIESDLFIPIRVCAIFTVVGALCFTYYFWKWSR